MNRRLVTPPIVRIIPDDGAIIRGPDAGRKELAGIIRTFSGTVTAMSWILDQVREATRRLHCSIQTWDTRHPVAVGGRLTTSA